MLLLLATSRALAVYAALALVLMVAATSRERGRALSALRTLGLDARTASALTFAELAPLAVAAVVGGHGDRHPHPLADVRRARARARHRWVRAARAARRWWPIVGAVAAVTVALVVAVLVEGATRRRDQLGDVLRVGER